MKGLDIKKASELSDEEVLDFFERVFAITEDDISDEIKESEK